MRGLLFILFVCFRSCAWAQLSGEMMKIEVSTNKTTNLVFPSAIVSVDRGNEQVIVQRAGENILRVKAIVSGIKETNLTVTTADQKLYSFLVSYSDNPGRLTLFFGPDKSVRMESKWKKFCDTVQAMKANIAGARYAAGHVSLQLIGWYVHGAQMYCKLKIENRSQIGYDIDQVRWYLRDNSAVKRTASQEMVVQPVFVYGDTGVIKSHSSRIWIVAVEKFTIPDEKHFAIEILEKNGGRHLYLKSNNRQVMLAKEF